MDLKERSNQCRVTCLLPQDRDSSQSVLRSLQSILDWASGRPRGALLTAVYFIGRRLGLSLR